MGSARSRSWSLARERMLRNCPRQFFYQYFPHGEENEVVLGFLKNATTLPLLVGTIAHDMIAMALRLFKTSGRVKTNLKAPGLILLDDAISASANVAKVVRRGRSVQLDRQVLLHHLENAANEQLEALARERLITYLDAFEESQAWETLKTTDRLRWEGVPAATDPMQYVDPSPSLGFDKGFSLRIYTPFDAAIRMKSEFILIDWKTGTRTSKSVVEARRQTASYSLWALDRGIRLERIRLQPYWLQAGEPWNPQPVTPEELQIVRQSIVQHDKAERELIRETIDKKGNATFFARIDDFPTKPGIVCGQCKYRLMCPDGKALARTTSHEATDL